MSLREKCPNTEFFLVRILRIWTNTGKYGPEKIPYLDIFRAVTNTSDYREEGEVRPVG